MNPIDLSRYTGAFALVSTLLILPLSAHDHFSAGIVDSNKNGKPDAGEPLQLVADNGTNRTFHLMARPIGQRCGGYYMLDELPRTLFPLDSFSLTAQSDGQYEIAGANHAHTGAWLWIEIVSVEGPAGGKFGFWDEYSQTPTYSLAANQPTNSPKFVISEGIDDVSDDPQGHIHGRAWTATKPGDYYVGLRVIDRSTTGPGGGPWHTPSPVYKYHFSAGPSFQPTIQRNATTGATTLTWPSQMGIWHEGNQSGVIFKVYRNDSLNSNTWQNIGSVTGTTASSLNFSDPLPLPGKAFYRLVYSWATP